MFRAFKYAIRQPLVVIYANVPAVGIFEVLILIAQEKEGTPVLLLTEKINTMQYLIMRMVAQSFIHRQRQLL